MSKEIIIYIEDEERPRETYKRLLGRIFGAEFEIVALEPDSTIREMVAHLENYSDIVSYVIDEKLNHTGVANYTGTELVNEIRVFDQKIPVYILTSYADSFDSILGDVEFVVDKNDASDDEKREQLAKRMRRHLNTFNDIKNVRFARLDVLLKKSVNEQLLSAEKIELDELNFWRAKKIYIEEQGASEALKIELDKQETLLDQIKIKLENLTEK